MTWIFYRSYGWQEGCSKRIQLVQVTVTFYRDYGWQDVCSRSYTAYRWRKYSAGVMVGRRAAVSVYSIQVTGTFYSGTEWQEGCNESIQHTANRIVRQIQRKLTGAFDRRWFEWQGNIIGLHQHRTSSPTSPCVKGKSGCQDTCSPYPNNGATVLAEALIGGFPTVIGIAYEYVRATVKIVQCKW
jgi:hypothetical protein